MKDLDLLFKLETWAHPVDGDTKLIISRKGVSYEQWEAIVKLGMLLRITGTIQLLTNKFTYTMSFVVQELNDSERKILFRGFEDAKKLVEEYLEFNSDGKMSFPDIVHYIAKHKRIRLN
jgi:hypothetical protein